MVAGSFEYVLSGRVPETVALTEENILVGCMRNSHYYWSDDLGSTWQPLAGIPDSITRSRECYQPWIQYLGNGRFACAGHYGEDDAFGSVDQFLMIHFFRLEVLRRTKSTPLELTRDFEDAHSRWKNAYTLRLTVDGRPLAGKKSWNSGGSTWKAGLRLILQAHSRRTYPDGRAFGPYSDHCRWYRSGEPP